MDLTYLPGRVFSTGETLLGLYTDYYRARGYYLYSYDESDYTPSLQFSGIISLDVVADGQVVSVPVEKGSFAAYNKLEQPVEVRAVMAFEGEESDLQRAVDTLLDYKSGTQLLTFTTPQHEFENMNLQGFTYQMSADSGTNVLFADIRLIEVREVEPQYTDAKAAEPITPSAAKKPSNASPIEQGKKVVEGEKPRDASILRQGFEKAKKWDQMQTLIDVADELQTLR